MRVRSISKVGSVCRHDDLEFEPAGVGQALHHAGDFHDQLAQIGALLGKRELAGLQLGEIEHVVDQLEQVAGIAIGRHHVAAVGRRQGHAAVAFGRRGHHLGEADDEVERCAQLVRNVGDKFRFEAIGLLR